MYIPYIFVILVVLVQTIWAKSSTGNTFLSTKDKKSIYRDGPSHSDSSRKRIPNQYLSRQSSDKKTSSRNDRENMRKDSKNQNKNKNKNDNKGSFSKDNNSQKNKKVLRDLEDKIDFSRFLDLDIIKRGPQKTQQNENKKINNNNNNNYNKKKNSQTQTQRKIVQEPVKNRRRLESMTNELAKRRDIQIKEEEKEFKDFWKFQIKDEIFDSKKKEKKNKKNNSSQDQDDESYGSLAERNFLQNVENLLKEVSNNFTMPIA